MGVGRLPEEVLNSKIGLGQLLCDKISPGLTMPSPSEPKPFFPFFPVFRILPVLPSPRLAIFFLNFHPVLSCHRNSVHKDVLEIRTACPGRCSIGYLFLSLPSVAPLFLAPRTNLVQNLLRGASVAPSFIRSVPARCMPLYF